MYKPVVDFIHGLYHSDDFVPLHAPCFIGNEKKYLNECNRYNICFECR